MAEYNGSIELISGITQKGGGTFPLAAAKDIQVDDNDKRLDEKLTEIDNKLAKSATGEIPFFDLAELGLPEVPMDGTLSSVNTDTTNIKSALDNGCVKFAFNAVDVGRVELVTTKYSVDGVGLYVCAYATPDGTFMIMVADGALQVATVPATGSGVSSWNDLTDRPFGDNTDGTVTQLDNKYLSILSQTGGFVAILPRTTSTTVLNELFGLYAVIVRTTLELYAKWNANATTIRVVWDGKTYDCTPDQMDGMTYVGNASALGGSGNNEPFLIGMSEDGAEYYWVCFALQDTTNTQHTVTVSMNDPALYTVGEEHLPMDTIKNVVDDYITEALGGDY